MNYNGTDWDGMSPERIRESCEDMVRHPGKFEAEPVYAPWFYHLLGISGQDDEMDGNDGTVHYMFIPGPEDKDLFPELASIEAIHCYESDTGFFNTEECTIKEWEAFKTEAEWEPVE